ncbi:MAG TPA: endolytic transglycosylase MltG [Burkholderiaceae bacterium]|nr:endolytic transglycosylase MltG [Burkholderiaceae bacterium]
MKKFSLIALSVLLAVALVAGGLAAYAWHWASRAVEMNAERIQYTVPAGSGVRTIAQVMKDAGIDVNADGLVALARYTGMDRQIKAGAYEARRGDSPRRLLERMAAGDMVQARLTLVEGWTYQRIRQALRESPAVRQTLDGVDDAELLKRLGSQYPSPEGLFMPDTYVFVPGTTDFDILRQAYRAQQDFLQEQWEQRSAGLPLATPYEALILASIVEKETGRTEERARVAGVFTNRLQRGMLLQTDPTVIYGMGEKYDGRIRKRDLQTDTPWNTYTRAGLPPTPIASPGRASILAALHPESHAYYYFVARGDGSSAFSANLREHNRAVSKYILGRN